MAYTDKSKLRVVYGDYMAKNLIIYFLMHKVD